MSLIFFQKAAQDNLLPQRRQGIAHRRVELLEYAVSQTGKTAHRYIGEALLREGFRQPVLRRVGALVRHQKKGLPLRMSCHIFPDFPAAPLCFPRAGAAEYEMKSHGIHPF